MKRSAITCLLELIALLFAPAQAATVPKFQFDPKWPQAMPNGYFFGQIAGLTEDYHGNIWVISRPRSIVPQLDEPPQPASGVPAPSVVEFDANGKFLRGWGGPFAMSDAERAQFDWPAHGTWHRRRQPRQCLDLRQWPRCQKTGKDDNQCLKFTTDGKFLMQIGKSAQSKGSLDTANLNHAAWPVYYAPANELFVADGYVNRRVIVFDADTGKFKRMWGAYGKAPDDSVSRNRAYDPPPTQFNLVHGLTISKDGIVYVADRNNNRVQSFTLDGKFLKEAFVAREIPMKGFGTVNSVALSGDKDQRFLYICEGHQQRVRVLDRKTLRKFRKRMSAMSASIATCFWGCTSSSPTPRATSIPAMAATAGCSSSTSPDWPTDLEPALAAVACHASGWD